MTIPEIQINNSAREDIEREYNPKFSIYHKKLIGVGDVTIFVDVYDDPQKGIPYNIYLDGAFFEGRSILDVENQKVPLKFVMLDITHLIEGNYEGVDPKLRQARGLVRICKIYDSILMLIPQVNAEYYQYSWDKSGYFSKRDGERQYIPPFYYAKKGTTYAAIMLDQESDESILGKEYYRIFKDIKSSPEKMKIINDILDEASGCRLIYNMEQWEDAYQKEKVNTVALNKDDAVRLKGKIENCFYGTDLKIAGVKIDLNTDDYTFRMKSKKSSYPGIYKIDKEIVMSFNHHVSDTDSYSRWLGFKTQKVNSSYILSELVDKDIIMWIMPESIRTENGAFLVSANIFIEGWLYQSKPVRFIMTEFRVTKC